MSWKDKAVRVLPSNSEWALMQTLVAKPLTAAQIREKDAVQVGSVASILTRLQAKNLVRSLGRLPDNPKAMVFGLTAYGEQLIKVVKQFSKRRTHD